jgi:hypothetical protein
LIAAASNKESFAGSCLSRSNPVPAPRQQLEVVVQIGAPSSYFLGAEDNLDHVDSRRIRLSTYVPNLTRQVLTSLTTHPNARNLFLLGVKYQDEQGGDVQAGISESAHVRESPGDTAFRGIREELHIQLSEGFTLNNYGHFRNHVHYFAEITSEQDYSLVPIDEIVPEPSKDDKVNKGKASVYLFGTLDVLEPILRGYQPPAGRPNHDPIDKLCAIPFSELRRF